MSKSFDTLLSNFLMFFCCLKAERYLLGETPCKDLKARTNCFWLPNPITLEFESVAPTFLHFLYNFFNILSYLLKKVKRNMSNYLRILTKTSKKYD